MTTQLKKYIQKYNETIQAINSNVCMQAQPWAQAQQSDERRKTTAKVISAICGRIILLVKRLLFGNGLQMRN